MCKQKNMKTRLFVQDDSSLCHLYESTVMKKTARYFKHDSLFIKVQS